MNRKMDYKKAFCATLEDCYLGVKIKLFHQGNTAKTGFSNLLKIKEQYFSYIKNYLDLQLANEPDSNNICNKLNDFFSSYLNESGTPFFNDTPIYKNIYAKIYSASKDTALFYKTQNLYYVKSDRLYESLIIPSKKQDYEVYFDASEYKQNADNTKNKVIFKLFSITYNDENMVQIHIKVLNHKEKDLFPEINAVFKGNLNDFHSDFIKDIKKNELIKEAKISIYEEELKKIFKSYKKQSEIDFFIHKNARAFLQEQFDLWYYHYLFKESEIQEWNLHSIAHLQKIRNIALEVIRLIGDFEDELKAIWLKPKFAKKVEYVFSLDLIISEAQKSNPQNPILDSIFNDKGFADQVKEWQELKLIDENFDKHNILADEKYRYLSLDTKHFSKEVKYKILNSFENLEPTLSGELIKADNFQALNSLIPKYQNKIDLIYIDPPYNAPSSEIIYKNHFKDSTWLSMMENRLRLGREFLNKRGIFTCAIDENEQENLGLLLSDVFYDYEKTCVSVEHNPKGIQGDNFSYSNEFTYFLIPNKSVIQNKVIDLEYKELMKTGKESERHTAKNCFYPIYVKDSKIIGFGKVCKDDFHPKEKIVDKGNFLEIYPLDSNGNERKWRYARDSIEKVKDNLKVFLTKNSITIKLGKTEKSFKTMWYGAQYSATEYGSKILKDIILHNEFDYPKSIHTVKDSIYLASKEDSIILDFFGGSGTTAHAILELNKEGANRKFILVEQGEYFYSVIIPRIKKIAFSSEWKGGELKDNKQVRPINIAFRYYELESYEEALEHSEYVLTHSKAHCHTERCKAPNNSQILQKYNENMDSQPICEAKNYQKTQKIIDYRKSRKLIDRLNKGESVSLDMQTEYRKDFDIFHTMANLMGWNIKRLFLDSRGIESCEFANGEMLSSDFIELHRYPKLKNLIWWK